MAKQESRQRRPEIDDSDADGRAVELATVAWMMAVMTTLVCGSVAGLVWLYAHDRAGADNVMLFGHVIHFGAIVTGLVSLVLMAVVLKTRRERPPTSIIVASAIIAVLPLLPVAFR